MKLVVRVKLLPTPEQASALEATLRACNRAATQASAARHTSQRCPRCGHTERANRPERDHFRCRRCGLAGPADVVAGVNVRDRARSA